MSSQTEPPNLKSVAAAEKLHRIHTPNWRSLPMEQPNGEQWLRHTEGKALNRVNYNCTCKVEINEIRLAHLFIARLTQLPYDNVMHSIGAGRTLVAGSATARFHSDARLALTTAIDFNWCSDGGATRNDSMCERVPMRIAQMNQTRLSNRHHCESMG